MSKKLNKAKNALPENFRFSKNTSQQDTGEFYVSFIKKRTKNRLFREFKLFHEKGKWDFYRKSKNTVMNKCLRQKQAFLYCEIETHLFNTMWLIIGICFVLLLVAGGFEWKLAACCSLVSPHRVSVRSHSFALCQLWLFEQRAVMLGQCSSQTQILHYEIYGP